MMHACVEAWSEEGAGRAVGRAAAESRAGGRAVAGARARVDGTLGGGGDSAAAGPRREAIRGVAPCRQARRRGVATRSGRERWFSVTNVLMSSGRSGRLKR